jgi:hypothetical protein
MKRTIINLRSKRKKNAQTGTFLVSPSNAKLQMNGIVNTLNSETQRVPESVKGQEWDWEWRTRDVTERKRELRRLIGLWQDSDRNLSLLFKRHPELQSACRAGKTFLIPNRDGKAQLAWSPDLGDLQSSFQKKEALRLFVQFLVNPLSDKLQGPCARCDDYYLQSRPNNKIYCKRQCGSAKTALAAIQASREEVKNTRLEAAKKAVIEWENKPNGDWKESVAKRVSDCSRDPVTVKWVARAITNGELDPPSNA